MKKFFFLTLLCFGFACKQTSNNEIAKTSGISNNHPIEKRQSKTVNNHLLDSAALGINFTPKGDYNINKQTIKNDRAYFTKQFQRNKTKAIDSASNYLFNKLINELVPHWYGTPWDFNGHTNTPNNGQIACGYFVSTTLKHLGFQLNRYKMAQQGGMNEAISLQPRSELKVYNNITLDKLKTKLNSVYKDGIYFVGLSNHVGYIFIKNKELYFLHSSYCDNKVVIEKAASSPCFQSDIYVFAEITTNRNLIQKWIQNTAIPIHK
ncbi:hypothetical protein [uncultured Kordia sp.]|uniref:hypothetical protein n=1 Tax=uncultured Kordia sp. TaxID=507699 RepID=UPI00260F841E|nr:hypothetical protein [uncultured Kordia sp.]